MPSTKVPGSLQRAMQGAERTYRAADVAWFEYLDDQVTVYAIQSAEPIVGRDKYRSVFEKSFASTQRRMKVLHQDVNVLDETAVVAQTIQVEQSDVLFNLRQSVIWTQRDGEWKINHLHSALIGQPTGARTAKSAEDIRILNERIATVAAVLGVAQ